ncbi:MAG: glycosyltransferase [Actinobacteria bacterium]|nr:glycosyltransferase [Actinomycetota bacterium]
MKDNYSKNLFFTIIIPVKNKNDHLIENIDNCLNLSYPNFEILVFPDSYFDFDNPKVRIMPTGKIGPAEKRDLAIKYAKGDILAFLDDDAYPDKHWLDHAAKYFNDDNNGIAAVCGPAVTPKSDGLIQQLSGEIYTSPIACGNVVFRYKPVDKVFEVDDFPSVNFIIRKESFKAAGGFGSKFWPGEDTKLCMEIIIMGKKIIYDPKILVYHHRRGEFKKHLKQVFSYSIHRGYFVKKFQKNSAKFLYFMPSIFIFFLIVGAGFSFFYLYFLYFYISIIFIYMILLFINSILRFRENKNVVLSLLLIPSIFLTHIFYGSGFFKGLFSKELTR